MLHPRTTLGAHVVNKYASSSQTSAGVPIQTIAGATEDAVKVTGKTIDRYISDDALALSATLAIAWLATLADTKTVAFAVEYQDSADGSTWNTAVAMQASTVDGTGDGVATEFDGDVDLSLNLKPLLRYVRFNITADLSNTATDVVAWSAVCALAGFDVLPQ